MFEKERKREKNGPSGCTEKFGHLTELLKVARITHFEVSLREGEEERERERGREREREREFGIFQVRLLRFKCLEVLFYSSIQSLVVVGWLAACFSMQNAVIVLDSYIGVVSLLLTDSCIASFVFFHSVTSISNAWTRRITFKFQSRYPSIH